MKKNNKGFSLVELIIVIAIMAILAGALAPALIKYIAKSRRSTDVSNAQTIATAVTNALSVEVAYDDACNASHSNGSYVVQADGTQLGTADKFVSEVSSQLGASKFNPKYNKDSNFFIHIDSNKSTFQVGVEAHGSYPQVVLYPDVDEAYK